MLWFRSKKHSAAAGGEIPRHIAVIMDGNGRWAKKRGMPRGVGHRAGAQTLKRITTYCEELGVGMLTVYAFSTENWRRPSEEVEQLMELLSEYLSRAEQELTGKNVRIKVIGDLAPFSAKLKEEIFETERISAKNTGMVLNIALNYGARSELAAAVRGLIRDGVPPEQIDEEAVSSRLYTPPEYPVDLLIRPGGEYRLSNFLLWQCAYAELWFSNILWPDFKEEHLWKAIEDFQKRSRRYGGV